MNLDHLPEPPRGKYDDLITDEVDDALLKYWNAKEHTAIAKALGIPRWRLAKRHTELTSETFI